MNFNRSEALERVILEKLNWSSEFLNRHKENELSSEHTLNELRIIVECGPRQFGSTTAIVNLFDPSKDVLVAHSRGILNEYNQRLFDLGKVKNKANLEFKYLIHKFNNDLIVEEDIIRRISKLTISEYEDVTGKEFPLSNSYLSKKIYSSEFNKNISEIDSLRGKSFSDDTIVYIDASGSFGIKYYHNVLRLIQILDITCGRGKNIRYVIF